MTAKSGPDEVLKPRLVVIPGEGLSSGGSESFHKQIRGPA